MSNNLFYRILAIIGIVFMLAFGVLMAVYFGTRQSMYVFLMTGTGGIGVIIWMFLYMARKNLEKREELERLLKEYEENQKNPSDENDDTKTDIDEDKPAENTGAETDNKTPVNEDRDQL